MATKKLTEYTKKRNFKKTPEPSLRMRKPRIKHPIYVIQKHHARALHFDIRFELNGALVSFAVPKGPSLKPEEKRLAIRTEDHPLSYATFEGVIPEHQYGAGPVMVWDLGTYKNITMYDGKRISLEDALDRGHIEIFIDGVRIKGAFAFIHTKRPQQNAWLLIKMNDAFVNHKANPVRSQQTSVVTGRTFKQIESEDEKRVDKENRKKTTRRWPWD